jgi:hypothetical protein
LEVGINKSILTKFNKMNEQSLKSIIAGVFFGIWPLLLNRSGLNGNIATLVYVFVVLVCVIPFSLTRLVEISSAHWIYVVGAGIFGAIGLLLFNDVVAKATVKNIGLLFVLMLIAQTVVPAAYQSFVSDGISFQRLLGYLFAIISAILLITKVRF